MSVSLGLDQSPLNSRVESPSKHKSAGLAFLVSVFVPGAGQIYCGKVGRGGVTLAFFALSAALTVSGFTAPDSMGELLGVAMFALLVLYVFSFLDAYYVAREINAGIDPLVHANNPRVATTLNLLTNGFGYWYLGERNKGWTAFIVLGLFMRGVSQAIGDSPWSLVLLLIPCAMALDAHRIARKQLAEVSVVTPLSESIERPIRETRLPAAVPVGFALVLLLTMAGVVAIGLTVRPLDGIDQSRAVIEQNSDPKRYENPTYGVRLLVPVTWGINPADKESLATVQKDGLCQMMLMVDKVSPFTSLTAVREATTRDILQKNSNFRKVADRKGKLGNLSGMEAEFVENVDEHEIIVRHIMARRWSVVYSLVTTIVPSPEECEPDARWIQENISIRK